MSEKSAVIIRLVTAEGAYVVGEVNIEKIVFFSSLDPYNKNRCFEGPCYVIYSTDTDARRIVPMKDATGIEVMYVAKDEAKKKAPAEAFAYEDATKTTTEGK